MGDAGVATQGRGCLEEREEFPAQDEVRQVVLPHGCFASQFWLFDQRDRARRLWSPFATLRKWFYASIYLLPLFKNGSPNIGRRRQGRPRLGPGAVD